MGLALLKTPLWSGLTIIYTLRINVGPTQFDAGRVYLGKAEKSFEHLYDCNAESTRFDKARNTRIPDYPAYISSPLVYYRDLLLTSDTASQVKNLLIIHVCKITPSSYYRRILSFFEFEDVGLVVQASLLSSIRK
jgi:hypothetical protein